MTTQEIINKYRDEVSQIPTIKDNEEAKKYIDTILFSHQRASRNRARKRLAERSMPLIFNKVMKYFWSSFNQKLFLTDYQFDFVLDLIQEANIKMLKILDKKKYLLVARDCFLLYLRTSVKWTLIAYSIERGNPMKIPIREYLKEKIHRKFCSLDAPVNNETETLLKDFIPDPRVNIVRETEKMLLMKQVNEVLEQKNFLSSIERLVLEMRFSLFDGNEKKYTEITKLTGKFDHTIRKIEKTGIQKIREAIKI